MPEPEPRNARTFDGVDAPESLPLGRGDRLRTISILFWAVLCSAFHTAATEAAVPGLEQYLGRSRALILFAPSRDDPALLRQRSILADVGPGADERDLVSVEVIGNDPAEADLRGNFGAGGNHFRAVLVGKDGGAKLTSTEPFPSDKLFGVIDAMPMRRDESAARKPEGR